MMSVMLMELVMVMKGGRGKVFVFGARGRGGGFAESVRVMSDGGGVRVSVVVMRRRGDA